MKDASAGSSRRLAQLLADFSDNDDDDPAEGDADDTDEDPALDGDRQKSTQVDDVKADEDASAPIEASTSNKPTAARSLGFESTAHDEVGGSQSELNTV